MPSKSNVIVLTGCQANKRQNPVEQLKKKNTKIAPSYQTPYN